MNRQVSTQEDDLGGLGDSSMETSAQCSLAVRTTFQRVENKTENIAMALPTLEYSVEFFSSHL